MRLYYTAKGASEPFKTFNLGNPVGPRNNVDLAFLTPDGRNIDVRSLKPIEGPSLEGAWVRDIVAREKNQAGDGEEIVATAVELMKKISALYPAKKEFPSTPWQVSLSHGVFVAAWDSQTARNGGERDVRRLLVLPSPLDPALEKALESPEVLRKFERHYVFVKLDPKDAPAELKEPLEKAGPQGLLVLDTPRSVDGFGQSQDRITRVFPKLLASPSGPLTKPALVELLAKHVAR